MARARLTTSEAFRLMREPGRRFKTLSVGARHFGSTAQRCEMAARLSARKLPRYSLEFKQQAVRPLG